MTSTNCFTGMGTSRSSSRVLRPPGGGSHHILGFSNEPEEAAQKSSTETIPDIEDKKSGSETTAENVLPSQNPPKRVRVPPGGFSSGLW